MTWYKNKQKLELEDTEQEGGFEHTLNSNEVYCTADRTRLLLLANFSLLVCGAGREDRGDYHCVVATELENVTSSLTTLYPPQPWSWWWWIPVAAACLAIVVIVLILNCWCRSRRSNQVKLGWCGVYDY